MSLISTDISGNDLKEAFTRAYVKLARERYPTKNVVVYEWDALVDQDFDEFKESRQLDIRNGEKQIFSCLIFTSGHLEYGGVNDVAHFRFDGKFEVVDESHITFFEIPPEEVDATAVP
jgi:hypothetical protein